MLVMLLGLRLIVLSSTLPSQSGLTHPRDGTSAGSVRVGRAVRESLTTPAESTTNLTLQTLLREGPLLRISACGAGGAGDVVNYTPKAWQQSGRSRCFTSVRVGRAAQETTSRHYEPYFANLAAGGAAASHQRVRGRRCGRA